jgi:hypothetical protein
MAHFSFGRGVAPNYAIVRLSVCGLNEKPVAHGEVGQLC